MLWESHVDARTLALPWRRDEDEVCGLLIGSMRTDS